MSSANDDEQASIENIKPVTEGLISPSNINETQNGFEEKSLADLKSFGAFEVRQVLNSDSLRKSIVLLLEKKEGKKEEEKAVLICDRHAFEEDTVAEWVANARLRCLTHNSIYGNYELSIPDKFNEVKCTLIYPATGGIIQRYRKQEYFLLQETPENYQQITLKYIKESQKNLTWVYNLLNKQKEAERILLEDPDKHKGFILVPDLKWNGVNVEELYLQAVVHRLDLRSIRDLTAGELPLLINIRDKVANKVLQKYGLKKTQLKMYFHYQPSFYHLHVHVVNLKYDAPGLRITSVLLDQVIANIQMMPDFYKQATLPFICHKSLYKKFVYSKRI